MAIFTAAEKAQHIAQWKAALLAVAEGQEFTVGTRRLRYADLPSIQAHLDWLDSLPTVEDEAAGLGSPQFHEAIPRRYPGNYTAETSRKVGGFPCLCAAVGAISGHPLTGYVAGDILPAGVWDLKHRPVCAPEGMVYIAGIGKWVDIYLASVNNGQLASLYGGTCADGASATAFDWYDFAEWLGRIGKRLPTQSEFMAFAGGSNEGTNIAGSADPVTTGGKLDTAGRRMVSNYGCEDCCGILWQWLREAGGQYNSTASYFDQYTVRTSQRGQGIYIPVRAIAGGAWSNAENCGSRGSAWDHFPLNLSPGLGARGIADPLAVAL